MRGYVADMVEHALLAESFVEGVSEEEFADSLSKRFAVERALEIIGEAAKSVPQEVRDLAPQVQWKQMTGMRDKLVHQYFGVDPGIVWQTATSDMSPLVTDLNALLEILEGEES